MKKVIEAWRKCDKVNILFLRPSLPVTLDQCDGETFFFLRYSDFGSFNMPLKYFELFIKSLKMASLKVHDQDYTRGSMKSNVFGATCLLKDLQLSTYVDTMCHCYWLRTIA